MAVSEDRKFTKEQVYNFYLKEQRERRLVRLINPTSLLVP